MDLDLVLVLVLSVLHGEEMAKEIFDRILVAGGEVRWLKQEDDDAVSPRDRFCVQELERALGKLQVCCMVMREKNIGQIFWVDPLVELVW